MDRIHADLGSRSGGDRLAEGAAELTDEVIQAALEEAEIPPLLPALAHLTGDLSLLDPSLAPTRDGLRQPQGGLSPEQQRACRVRALNAIIAWRDSGCPPPGDLRDDDLCRLMEFTVGETVPTDYLPLLRQELSATTEDLRAPDWTLEEIAPDRELSVAVIGAGMSGILVSHRLAQAGIPHTIYEKNDQAGGTWYENTYPGCRVDISNHLYSYSFAQRTDWPFHYSTQPVLREYFQGCADRFGITPRIRFGTEVRTATFDEEAREWALELIGPHERVETARASVVISAVGQLNRPKLPDIEGIDTFEGPSFHSARWDHGIDLADKRVAVIGTGASSAQFVPEIADIAGSLTVFQRTPPWLIPTPEYHAEVPAGLSLLFRRLPLYSQWHRFWLFWRNAEGILDAVRVDPDWDGRPDAVGELNDLTRQLLTEYIVSQTGDDTELASKLIPHYPPGAKRLLRDNGIWISTLRRDDVHLETTPIARITPRGVETTDGVEHPADVIIYGTGFRASDFLTPMQVVGRGGVELHDRWQGDARAHLGMTVPGFPNLFLLYGPNTNIVVNGSIIYFSECETGYILDALRLMAEKGIGAIDCRPEVHDAYNRLIDEGNLKMAWGVSDVNSWYRNRLGRVAQNWPFTLLDFWERTREVALGDYELL